MDAEFFCLDVHQDAVGQLVHYLTTRVDPTIALKVRNADAGTREERAELGQRYTKLLHASIPPERELNIEANSTIELFGNRIYLRVYWPILTAGYYWYPGVAAMVNGIYWTTYERQFHARGRGLEQFLPALAIRDRMVLVPRGQNETLESMGSNNPDLPPLQRGVIEVDFADADDLDHAFVTVGEELRRELRREMLAYQSFQPPYQADLDTVSAHLGVPPGLLHRAIREESDARELIYRQLRCSIEPMSIVRDVQTRVRLRIDNPSTIDLGRLRVQVRGPADGMHINPERVEVELPAGAVVTADFSVAATREGEFVLEILFLEPDVEARREMLPIHQIWITSWPPAARM